MGELEATTRHETWKIVPEAALARIRDSKRAGNMPLLLQGLTHTHELHTVTATVLRNMEANFKVPAPIHLFLGRFFIAFQAEANILELDQMLIGENALPSSIPVQGVLLPCVVKGKDEQGLKLEVHGILLILFSSIAVMPAQLSGVENVSDVLVNLLPNGTAVSSFYDSKTNNIVIDVVR